MEVCSSNEPLLSVLIVNFNGKQYLSQCIQSIRKNVSVSHEIIIVDNASTDGSVESIVENFTDVVLITSKTNLGFAAGNNLAARSAKGEYFLLLNNDTLLIQAVDDAISLLASDSLIGALGCKILGRSGEYRLSVGHFPTPLKLISFSTLFKRDGNFATGNFSPNSDCVYDVDWVEGSFILTRSVVWQQLGGMDEGYFLYVEDVDFCRRVYESGFRVVYYPELSFVHYGGYSSARLGMLIRGYRRYHRKFSSYLVQVTANLILTCSLFVKVVAYGLMSLLRGRGLGPKSLSCWAALRDSPW